MRTQGKLRVKAKMQPKKCEKMISSKVEIVGGIGFGGSGNTGTIGLSPLDDQIDALRKAGYAGAEPETSEEVDPA